ncbi:DUF1289 domain-containing protein [Rhizobium sp. 0TCS1.26]|uniref:DUF1289 domain-containing protein n=1 Tax=Rhizobium sp. 0TCS1.26 TaxID=3142623 RepID=UPI003D26BB27
MISPCILVCAIDDATGLCVGCGRTGGEIGAWTLYTDGERAAVMAALPARMQGIEPKSQHEIRRSARRRRQP